MKKMALSVTAFSMITAGLAGCGTGDDAATGPDRGGTGMNQVDNQQQAGWDNQRGDRGEGPITDMFTVDDRNDRNQEQQGARNVTDGRGSVYHNNPQDVTDQRADRYEQNQGAQQGDQGDQANMANDQGQLDEGNQPDDEGQRELADEIEEQVEDMNNVDDSHVVVDDENVVVGVQIEGDDEEGTRERIQQEVEDEIDDDDKEVFITDDEENFENLGDIGNDMAEGTGNAIDETSETIQDIIDDVGDATQRPFERSR